MKTTGNTILITGGSAGIGLEIAKAFSESGNQVIITGRDEQRLANAASQLKNVTPIVSDISPKEVADALIHAFETDTFEVRVGRTESLFQLYLSSPTEALRAMNPGAKF